MNTLYIELGGIPLAIDYEADSYEEIDLLAIRPYNLDADFMPVLQQRIVDICYSQAEVDYSSNQFDMGDSMSVEKLLDDRDRAQAIREQLT